MLDIKKKILDNKTTCYVVNKPNYNQSQIMVAFNYGSSNIEFELNNKTFKQPYGIAHFLEHKMFEQEDENIFNSFSKLGLSANAFTNFKSTAYYFSGCENIYEGFKLLVKMVSSLYLTKDNVEKEKGIITQEINMYKDDPYWQIYFNLLKAMYSKNPIRESVAGDVCDIEKIDINMLYDSYNSFYSYENCVVIACGNLDSEKIFEIAENLKLNTNSPKKLSYNDHILKHKISENMPVTKPIYHIGIKDVRKGNLVDKICINNIIFHLLFANSSPLYENLYTNKLIDDSFSYEILNEKDYGFLIIKGEGDSNKVLKEIIEEISSYILKGIEKETFSRIVKKLKTQILFSFENISSINNLILDCYTKNIEILDIYNNYDTIEVEQVVNTMKELFKEENIVLSEIKEI